MKIPFSVVGWACAEFTHYLPRGLCALCRRVEGWVSGVCPRGVRVYAILYLLPGTAAVHDESKIEFETKRKE